MVPTTATNGIAVVNDNDNSWFTCYTTCYYILMLLLGWSIMSILFPSKCFTYVFVVSHQGIYIQPRLATLCHHRVTENVKSSAASLLASPREAPGRLALLFQELNGDWNAWFQNVPFAWCKEWSRWCYRHACHMTLNGQFNSQLLLRCLLILLFLFYRSRQQTNQSNYK